MKIGVEASAIFQRNKTGVGYYSHDVVRALAKEMPDDEIFLSYISFFTNQPSKIESDSTNIKYRRFRFVPGRIYNGLDHYLNPITPPFDLLTGTNADVFLFPNFFRWPLLLTKKSIVFIHDLAYMDTPEYLVPRHQEYLSRRVPQSARKATHIVAISGYTKQQLIKHYDISPDKITVVPPSIDHAQYLPQSEEHIKAVRAKYNIKGKYLLYLGTIEPRKNLASLLRAYIELPKTIQDEYQLVLAGSKGWLDAEINELADKIPGDRLVRTGYVDDNDKPALYSGAELFVYPTHYEGWGMQILESLACATPVISSNNSSLPEAGGDAVYYLSENTSEEIVKGITHLLANQKIRQDMAAKGLQHVSKYTWENSAKTLASVIRRVSSGNYS